MAELILGSASPRRADYLRQLGVSFVVQVVDYDESMDISPSKSIESVVEGLIQSKLSQLRSVIDLQACCLVADTVVVLDDCILGKPESQEQACEVLQQLSGRVHQVVTGVAVGDQQQSSTCIVSTEVQFRHLEASEIRTYVKTGEPMDKAGSYGLQGLGGAFVSEIRGSVSAVVGLPLAETLNLLNQWQIPHTLTR